MANQTLPVTLINTKAKRNSHTTVQTTEHFGTMQHWWHAHVRPALIYKLLDISKTNQANLKISLYNICFTET